MSQYTVATVSTRVMGNFIANSIPASHHGSLEEAKDAAIKLDAKLNEELKAMDDYGNGAIRGESVIVHNGYQCF